MIPLPRLIHAVFSRRARITAALALALGAAACGNGPRLAYRTQYHTPEAPMAFKRAPRWEELDLLHRWRPRAYTSLKPDPAAASADEADVLRKFGPPEHMRRFRSRDCEPTTEWVYIAKNALFQFVDGALAYSGPATDKEKILIMRGYPNRAMRYSTGKGPEREDFIYWNWIHTDTKVYSFANGYFIDMQE